MSFRNAIIAAFRISAWRLMCVSSKNNGVQWHRALPPQICQQSRAEGCCAPASFPHPTALHLQSSNASQGIIANTRQHTACRSRLMICHQGSAGCHCDYSSARTAAKGLCHQQSERSCPAIPALCLHKAARQRIPETAGTWVKEWDCCWHRGGDWHSPASMEQLCHHPAASASSRCQGSALCWSSVPAPAPPQQCPQQTPAQCMAMMPRG